jgi:heterodisulfide reductase subunit B
MVSVESMCKTLDVKLNEIPDWNCCGASIGYAEGGELPRHIMNARNIALSEQHNPKQDIVATCAACWLGTKETQERISHSGQLLADVNDILKDAGLSYEGKQPVRHMVEVLIEDLGYDELKKPVK